MRKEKSRTLRRDFFAPSFGMLWQTGDAEEFFPFQAPASKAARTGRSADHLPIELAALSANVGAPTNSRTPR